MKNEEDKLISYLKKNAPQPPAASEAEKHRIWKAIEAEQHASSWHLFRTFLSRPQLRIAVPAMGFLLVVFGTLHIQKLRHDAEVDRVLRVALAYQLEESGDDSIF